MAEIEDLRAEYKEVGSNLRFLNGSRLGLITMVGTLVTILVGRWWDLLQLQVIGNTPSSGTIVWWAQVTLPVSGLILVAIVYLIERRTLRLYDGVLQRGIELEDALKIENGTYQRIQRKIVNFPGTTMELTLRRVMVLVYCLAALFLGTLLLISLVLP